MNCANLEIFISGYIDGELSSQQQDVVEEHILQCHTCKDKVSSYKDVKRGAARLEIPMPTQQQWNMASQNILKEIHTTKLDRSRRKRVLYRVAMPMLAAAIALIVFLFFPSLIEDKESGLDAWWKEIKHTPVDVKPAMKHYKIPHNVAGIESTSFTAEEKEFLLKEGFVVTKREFSSFPELYRENHQRKIPSFITAESATAGLSHILSRLTIDIEREVLFYRFSNLTEILSSAMWEIHNEVPREHNQASLRVLAFLRVASILLGSEQEWPEDILTHIDKEVEAELNLINNSRQAKEVGIKESPIFGYQIDYNKFKHEIRDERLRRYKQAHEWFARCIFRSPGESETYSALLILMATLRNNSDGLVYWEEIHQILTFIYGNQDAPSISDYLDKARKVYGHSLTVAKLKNKRRLRRFGKLAARIHPPRIHSEVGFERGLRIFGRRDIGCDYIFTNLCWPFVGEAGDPRIAPSVLDIGVIMGSDLAKRVTKKRGDFSFKGYEGKVNKYQTILSKELEGNPWIVGGFVGDAWMYDSLMQPVGKRSPVFTHSRHWDSRKLTTILCGSSGMLGRSKGSRLVFTGKSDFNFKGIVDPYPEFFNRMVTRVRSLELLLKRISYPMDRGPAREIDQYKRVLKGLVKASENMLKNKTVTKEDLQSIWNFALGWEGTHESSKIAELNTLFYRNDDRFDVHHYTGIGSVHEIWVAIPIDGKVRLARGGTFLLYEFNTKHKISDETWRQVPSKPGLMPWIKNYTHE